MTDEHPTHRFLCSTSPGVEDPDDPPVVTPATPTFSSGLVTSRATFPSLPRHRRRTRRSTTLTAPPLPPPPPRYDSRLPTGTTTIGNHHYRYDHHYHCHSPPRVAGTAARRVVWQPVCKRSYAGFSLSIEVVVRLNSVRIHCTILFERVTIEWRCQLLSLTVTIRVDTSRDHRRGTLWTRATRGDLRAWDDSVARCGNSTVSWPIYAPVCSPKPRMPPPFVPPRRLLASHDINVCAIVTHACPWHIPACALLRAPRIARVWIHSTILGVAAFDASTREFIFSRRKR